MCMLYTKSCIGIILKFIGGDNDEYVRQIYYQNLPNIPFGV